MPQHRQRHDHRDAVSAPERARDVSLPGQVLREQDVFRIEWNLLPTFELDLATTGDREDVLTPRRIVTLTR